MSRAWWTVPGPDGGGLELRQVLSRRLSRPRCWSGYAAGVNGGVDRARGPAS